MQDTPSKVVNVDIEREVKRSFMEYAVSCIVSRALPDVRDGLKPVHRRILYTMFSTGLTPEKAYRKSVTTVGDVLGKYHPHGDASVYDAMVRLAQDFSLRAPLVDGHGNFGSVDGDPPAAYRYTEAKMTKLSLEMLRDIDKDTVEFMPNFDGRLTEPVVLPSRFPNILVNGASGIAVCMATNIPPHNLGEVIDGALYLLENPEATLDDLMKLIPGPDFPTGGVILGRTGIRSAYGTGRGHIKVRGKADIEQLENGRSRIIITEIPYLVNKARLCASIADLVKEKRVEGITAIRDESSLKGIRIVIEMSRSAYPAVVLNRIYRYTQLEDTFAANMIALTDDNTPRVLTLKEILSYYLAHQKEVIVRRTRYDLKKALDRANILEGLRIAVDNIEEVVRIIRASGNVSDAKRALMERFSGEDVSNMLRRSGIYDDNADNARGLNEEQATAIVSMTLGQLTGLGIDRIEKEFEEKMAIVRACREILGSEERVKQVIEEEMREIRTRFADGRRTLIEAVDNEIDVEDLIKEETCVFTLTQLGYIKRLPADTYRVQRRGGRGVSGMSIREEDVVDKLFISSSHDIILFFTSAGRVFKLKGYQIPEAGRTGKGTNIVNLLNLDPEERVTNMLHIDPETDAERSLVLVTRRGTVKRMDMEELRSMRNRKAGLRALELAEGDALVGAMITSGSDDVIIGTRQGMCVSFCETTARAMGRTAVGVIGIRLQENDEVVGCGILEPGAGVLTVTENGFGKITPEDEFPRHNRGGKGVCLHSVNEKTGGVAGLVVTQPGLHLMLVTSEGTVIRTEADTIRSCGRGSQGVRVMRTGENERVISLASVDEGEEDEDLTTDAERADDVENSVENVNNSPAEEGTDE